MVRICEGEYLGHSLSDETLALMILFTYPSFLGMMHAASKIVRCVYHL